MNNTKPTLDSIDFVLSLYNESNNPIEYFELCQMIKDKRPGILIVGLNQIIYKLFKDGYIVPIPTSSDDHYKISFEGKVFIEEGGYKVKSDRIDEMDKRQRDLDDKNLRLTRILVAGAIVPAVYYFLEIVKMINIWYNGTF